LPPRWRWAARTTVTEPPSSRRSSCESLSSRPNAIREATVVRAAQRQRGGNQRRGHRFEVLTSAQPGQRAELSRHTLAPGGATGAADDPPMHEPGSRETALVEQGEVVLVCDGQRHELHEGDCVTFDADLPHHFENHSAAEAAFLAVVSAGLRRS
jgi:mannose-6-phosphate isomerase-like protein (cupin superfamily)